MPQTLDDPLQSYLINARRHQILNAAAEVFAEKGFHRATIRDIARVAGVADGTIYNYFENKSALLLGLLDRLNQTEQRESHFAQSTEMDLASFVHMYLNQRFASLTDIGFDVFHVLLSEILVNPELRATYYQQVIAPTFAVAEKYAQGWVTQGAEQTIDPQLMLRGIAGMTLGVLLLRLMGDPYLQTHWNSVPDVLAELILHGIAPANGDHHDPTDHATDHPA
ncbi:MAG TPA: TetR/AcrR family transcriptional regulator [Herpetosiphonaceae bacterium]